MAWFENHYRCPSCRVSWSDEWSCTCNDKCAECGKEIEPRRSKDLSVLIKRDGTPTKPVFTVLRSPDSAEDDPNYQELGPFPTKRMAERVKKAIEENGDLEVSFSFQVPVHVELDLATGQITRVTVIDESPIKGPKHVEGDPRLFRAAVELAEASTDWPAWRFGF